MKGIDYRVALRPHPRRRPTGNRFEQFGFIADDISARAKALMAKGA